MSHKQTVSIALDAHGGDHGAAVNLPAAVSAVQQHPELRILLVGQNDHYPGNEALPNLIKQDRISLIPSNSQLTADASPREALKAGTQSSLGKALQLVADGQAQACVSAGSTAALLTLSRKLIGCCGKLRRPALISRIPAVGGHTYLLDLGANVGVNAAQLVDFALMGEVIATQPGSPDRPTVALLNVGDEAGKGHQIVQQAARELNQRLPNFVGFVEGGDIFAGKVDVAVCDGFAGNLVLKSSEGLARMLLGLIHQTLQISAPQALSDIKALYQQFDPTQHNGAALVGLRAVVVKSHGAADQAATVCALTAALDEVHRDVPLRIQQRFQ